MHPVDTDLSPGAPAGPPGLGSMFLGWLNPWEPNLVTSFHEPSRIASVPSPD